MKYRKLLLLPLSRLPDIVGSPTTRRIRMSDLKSAESEISSDRCTYLASRTYLVLNIPQLDFLQLVEIKRSLITHLQDLPAMSRLNEHQRSALQVPSVPDPEVLFRWAISIITSSLNTADVPKTVNSLQNIFPNW